MTAKMKMMMHKTNVKLPKAPTVVPIMEMSKFSVGHDLANLKTLNCMPVGKKKINELPLSTVEVKPATFKAVMSVEKDPFFVKTCTMLLSGSGIRTLSMM